MSFIQKLTVPGLSKMKSMPFMPPRLSRPCKPRARVAGVSAISTENSAVPQLPLSWTISFRHSACASAAGRTSNPKAVVTMVRRKSGTGLWNDRLVIRDRRRGILGLIIIARIPRPNCRNQLSARSLRNLNCNCLAGLQIRKSATPYNFHMNKDILRMAKNIDETEPALPVKPLHARRHQVLNVRKRVLIHLRLIFGLPSIRWAFDVQDLGCLEATARRLRHEFDNGALGNRTPAEVPKYIDVDKYVWTRLFSNNEAEPLGRVEPLYTAAVSILNVVFLLAAKILAASCPRQDFAPNLSKKQPEVFVPMKKFAELPQNHLAKAPRP